MSSVFILQNQDQQYFNKRGEWTHGEDAGSLYCSVFKDEALNQKLELTVRHPELRINVVECQPDTKGRPQLPCTGATSATQSAEATSRFDEPEAFSHTASSYCG